MSGRPGITVRPPVVKRGERLDAAVNIYDCYLYMATIVSARLQILREVERRGMNVVDSHKPNQAIKKVQIQKWRIKKIAKQVFSKTTGSLLLFCLLLAGWASSVFGKSEEMMGGSHVSIMQDESPFSAEKRKRCCIFKVAVFRQSSLSHPSSFLL